jgi:hypothetical protein
MDPDEVRRLGELIGYRDTGLVPHNVATAIDSPRLSGLFALGGVAPGRSHPATAKQEALAKALLGLTYKHEIGQNKLRIPLEQMQAGYTGERTMKPAQQVSIEDLQGGTIIPLVGDRTLAGKQLASVNETPLSSPVNLQGGANFARDNPDVWASKRGAITNYANRINAAAEKGPVYLVHAAMGGRSGDFSRMMAEALLRQVPGSKIPKKAIAAFDKTMKGAYGDYGPDPNWPGLAKAQEGDWLDVAPGVQRTKMAQIMESAPMQQAGFPDVPSTRSAISEPVLRDLPSGTMGLAVSRAIPGSGQIVTDPAVRHPTYDTNLRGQYMGELPLTPRDALLPSFMATQGAKANRSHIDRAMLMRDIQQPVTQELVDKVMAFHARDGLMRLGALLAGR